MDKKLVLYDKNDQHEKLEYGQHKGKVTIKVGGQDKVLFDGWNKVTIAGSTFTACKHFPNLVVPTKTPTYNTELDFENIASLTAQEEKDSYVILFAVGIDGCGPENSQVFDVDYTKWIAPKDLVPFRYQLADNDLSKDLRSKYYGRQVNTTTNRIAYYFKAFESDPVYKQQYIDGTMIDENIYTSDNTLNAESYVELRMKVTKEDTRDFFISTTGINTARINTISLITGYPKTIDGYTYYQNLRPLTKLNFPNISLIDLDTGVDITYQIFY